MTQDALRQAAEDLLSRTLLASAQCLAISGLETGELLTVNDAYLDLCGYTRQEVVGRKFVPPGVDPTVEVPAEERGGVVRVWVEDNGIGIDARHVERVFKMFERLKGMEAYPGTGVGLAIVRNPSLSSKTTPTIASCCSGPSGRRGSPTRCTW